MLGRYTGNLSKTCLRVLFSCPPLMYMCVAMRVYVCCYPPLSLGGNFLEAVLVRRPPMISVEGREVDRSGSFERRSFSYNRVFRKRMYTYLVTFYCVLRGGEAEQTTTYRTMLVSSWREVGIPSRVERADSQPVLGGSNEVEHRCKNCATTKRERERGGKRSLFGR